MRYLSHMYRDPFAGIGKDWEELNELMGRISGDYYYQHLRGVYPPADVYETQDLVKVIAEIPGIIDKSKIEAIIDNNVLYVRGCRLEGKREGDGTEYYFRERYSGKFSRAISLPAEVDEDNARAFYRNGILTVEVPKSADNIQKSRKIEIN